MSDDKWNFTVFIQIINFLIENFSIAVSTDSSCWSALYVEELYRHLGETILFECKNRRSNSCCSFPSSIAKGLQMLRKFKEL